jgi:hypothetical protein
MNKTVFIALSLVSVFGCVSKKEDPLSKLAEGCLLDSQCESPLVCVFRRCHTKCEADRDCINGQKCAVTDNPYSSCLLPEEAKCKNGTCPGSLVCSTTNDCRSGCQRDSQCLTDEKCENYLCVNKAVADSGVTVAGFCSRNSDCPPEKGQDFCIANRCQAQCLEKRDCPGGFDCQKGQCLLIPTDAGVSADGGKICYLNSQCQQNEKCSPQGFCVPQCDKDIDCVAGVCSLNHQCMPPDAGAVDAGNAIPGFGRVCDFPSQCLDAGLFCGRNGTCGFQCEADVDCANPGIAGLCCRDNKCTGGQACVIPRTDAGVILTDGGVSGVGTVTIGNACTFDGQCSDGNACNGQELCVNLKCALAVRSFCDDSNPCTSDTCLVLDGGSLSCAYALFALDTDLDLFYPQNCGGNPPFDCDNNDATTYPNAPEQCDFRDNNCNGIIDEQLWQTEAAPTSFTSGSLYSAQVGPPAVKRVGSEVFVVASGYKKSGAYDLFRLSGNDLSTVGSPIELDGVTTSWEYCPVNMSYSTAEIWRPSLAVNGSQLLMGGFLVNRPSDLATCSSSQVATFRAGATLFSSPIPPFIHSDFSQVFRTTGVGLSRDWSLEAIYTSLPVMPVQVTWSPHIQKYVGVWWGNRFGTGTELLFNTIAPDGTADVPRIVSSSALLDMSIGVTDRTNVFPQVSVGNSSTLFVWMGVFGGTNRQVHFALHNAGLTLATTPFVRIPFNGNGGAREIESLQFDGQRYILNVVVNGSSNAAVYQFLISEDGSFQIRPLQNTNAGDVQSTNSAQTILIGNGGMLTAYKNNTAATGIMRLAYARHTFPDGGLYQFDGGFQYFDYDLGSDPGAAIRSTFQLVALDPKPGQPYRAGVIWSEAGDLKKMILKCQSP